MNKKALILVILLAVVSLSACANNPASTAYGTGAEVEASTATTAESGDTKETEGMTGSTPPASSFEPVREVLSESAEAESTASPNTAAPESSEKPATGKDGAGAADRHAGQHTVRACVRAGGAAAEYGGAVQANAGAGTDNASFRCQRVCQLCKELRSKHRLIP